MTAQEGDGEIEALRQGLWDCAKWAGADLDGDPTPAAMTVGLIPFAVEAVKDMREVYDEALSDGELAVGAGAIMTQRAIKAESEIEALRAVAEAAKELESWLKNSTSRTRATLSFSGFTVAGARLWAALAALPDQREGE